MNFHVVTLFPELIAGALAHGVVGQALRDKKIELSVLNPRKFASGAHQAVDDRPFGGGDGMIMIADVAAQALESIALPREGARLVYPSARGRRFDDALAREWAAESEIAFFCGRYGGVDQRLVETFAMEEVALGDYVLSGGEFAALAMIDAVSRFVPGVLGNADSPHAESFAQGLLEEPQFTRPREWRDLKAPEILFSGDHAKIALWKRDLALLSTASARPDLLSGWAAGPGSAGGARGANRSRSQAPGRALGGGSAGVRARRSERDSRAP